MVGQPEVIEQQAAAQLKELVPGSQVTFHIVRFVIAMRSTAGTVEPDCSRALRRKAASKSDRENQSSTSPAFSCSGATTHGSEKSGGSAIAKSAVPRGCRRRPGVVRGFPERRGDRGRASGGERAHKPRTALRSLLSDAYCRRFPTSGPFASWGGVSGARASFDRGLSARARASQRFWWTRTSAVLPGQKPNA